MIISIIVMIKDRHKYKQNKDAYKLIIELLNARTDAQQTRMVRETNKNRKLCIYTYRYMREYYNNKKNIHSVYRMCIYINVWVCDV